MSVGVTPNGNLYEKSNAGKIAATTTGAIAGAAFGLKNVGKIITYCDDVLAENASDKIKQVAAQVKDTFNGGQADKVKAAAEKYGTKVFDKAFIFLRNNPVKCFAAAGAAAALAFGAFVIDKYINHKRAEAVDNLKQQ